MKLTTALLLAGALLGSLALPAQHRPAAKATPQATDPALTAAIGRGQVVYKKVCLTCHQADGYGVPNLNPPLIKADYVLGDKARLARIVLAGLNEPLEIDGNAYHQAMPAQAYLTDQQVADVLTYVRNKFGNKASQVQVAEVKAVRASLK